MSKEPLELIADNINDLQGELTGVKLAISDLFDRISHRDYSTIAIQIPKEGGERPLLEIDKVELGAIYKIRLAKVIMVKYLRRDSDGSKPEDKFDLYIDGIHEPLVIPLYLFTNTYLLSLLQQLSSADIISSRIIELVKKRFELG